MKPFASIMTCLLLAGCVSYEPAPIDWSAQVEDWCQGPKSVVLSVADAQIRILAFSPELNALRLSHASSEEKAKASGYWEDPSLDLDILRVLKEPENPLTYGGSISFTLPLSGIPGLERKAAEAYAEADRWEVIAAEREAATKAAILVQTASQLFKLIQELEVSCGEETYVEARNVSERLVEAGELSRTDYLQQSIPERELAQTILDLKRELLSCETEIRKLGCYPVDCSFDWSKEMEMPKADEKNPGLLEFTRAPSVRTALARHEGKEKDLQKEVRRQYPELSFGPAYTREDGFDKVGITLGLTLPLWNRNRLGIAEAKGAREESRYAAITAWREVVLQYAEAKQALALVGELEMKNSRAEAHKLYEAGEMSAAEYVSCAQQEWTQYVNVVRRRIAAMEATYKINGLIESLKEE